MSNNKDIWNSHDACFEILIFNIVIFLYPVVDKGAKDWFRMTDQGKSMVSDVQW